MRQEIKKRIPSIYARLTKTTKRMKPSTMAGNALTRWIEKYEDGVESRVNIRRIRMKS